MTTLSERLKSWRTAQGITIEQAAQRIGVTSSTYFRWEKQGKPPGRLAMSAITKATGIKPEDRDGS